MTSHAPELRGNQKKRTHSAIVLAARELILAGQEITMPAVAVSALVSEATAYRYFPDLASLLREALEGTWVSPQEALAEVADSDDPVLRITFATEFLLRAVLRTQGAVRAMISATIARPETVPANRPGYRFGLIEHALAPLQRSPDALDPTTLTNLKQELAIILSAEALFVLTDLCGLTPEDAIRTAVRSARTITEAATRHGQPRQQTTPGAVRSADAAPGPAPLPR